MDIIQINNNTYKFTNYIIDMTTINGKEISSMSLKELKKYKLELEIRIGIQMGLDDVKNGRVVSEEEAHRILREWVRN